MTDEIFKFKPAQVPQASRGLRRSKYAATVEAVQKYLQEHADQPSVQIELGDADIKSATAGFRNAVAKLGPDTMRLVQRGAALYIERK